MTHSLRIIFAGTPEFAAVSLRSLLDSPHQVVAVYCQPDRPSGRGRKLQPGPVKQVALDAGIPVYQPLSLKTEEEQLNLTELNADLMVVAAYGLILPQAVLDIPKLGCVNIHASLLPRWRGAAPIQHAILAGDTQTGITIMQMDAGLDTGAMLNKAVCDILPTDTASSLHDRLAHMGADALVHSLRDLPQLQAVAVKQDDAEASYAHKINKADAQIDWSLPSVQIDRRIRAYQGWPVAYSDIGGQRVRIWSADHPTDFATGKPPGTILAAGSEGIQVACGQGQIRLTSLQLPGGRVLAITDILNAHQALFAPGQAFDIQLASAEA